MKNKFLLAAFLVLTAAPAFAAQLNTDTNLIDSQPETTIDSNTRFAKVIDDLPLMAGLQLVDDEDVLFEEPVLGRIAQTSAHGPVDIDELYSFYARSLPSLGWKRLDAKNYVRGGDHLRIDAHADGKETSVRFSVMPVAR